MKSDFRYYIHEGPEAVSFELAGSLTDGYTRGLEEALHATSSSKHRRSLIVDLTYLARIEPAALHLLRRWYQAGAHLVARLPQAKQIADLITGTDHTSVATIAPFRTWRPFHAALAGLIAIVTMLAPAPAAAADLAPETVEAWQDYIADVDAQNSRHLDGNGSFLTVGNRPERIARLRKGEILVTPASPQVPSKVPSGLIHHWIGAVFVPRTNARDIVDVLRDYASYSDIYHPTVISSSTSAVSPDEDRFSVVMMNSSVFARHALDGEYQARFSRLAHGRWFSIIDSVRIREIADYGEASQHTLPEDHGSGLIWRLHTVTRLEERDGGVYVEVEVVVLSRDIPTGLGWIVSPIVRRVSRSSLTTSLEQTKNAAMSGLHDGSDTASLGRYATVR